MMVEANELLAIVTGVVGALLMLSMLWSSAATLFVTR